MPFSMTHLCIAYNILSNTTQVKNPYDFMLGALALDSVHFADNYNSDMKKKSHLCVGDEINKMKHNILNSQFLDRVSVDVSLNKYVTLEVEFAKNGWRYL